ncbi:cell division protein ZapE [Cellulosimicrobium sp. PMB13]|uniref:cell division protein ZapE n=1 Tax=Cellulosimicrobium sp. PMB13 TaxID=3120158 RepID=UPI003F4B3611
MTSRRLDRVRDAVEAASAREGFTLDRGQRDVLERLLQVAAGLPGLGARRRPAPRPAPRPTSGPASHVASHAPSRPAPRGLYVWGPAGRGKSWLAGELFTAVSRELAPGATKRVHVYDLFRELHAAIHARRVASRGGARAAVGQHGPTRGWRTRALAPEPDSPDARPEPRPDTPPSAVDAAIDDLLRGTTLLYLDELHLHDSGDATLLTRLLRRTFEAGVVVLATSNYAPDTLLPNPLWHHLAEPGIALLREHLDVVELAGPTDYRSLGGRGRPGFAAGAWLAPGTTAQLAARGLRAPGPGEATRLRSGPRTFAVSAAREGHDAGPAELWVTFEDLATRATSTLEYLDWAARFPRWVVTGVPLLTEVDREAQQRFVAVVDVLCDADVELVVTSPHDRATFLAARTDRPDAFRTASRLQLLDAPVAARRS